MEETKEEAEAEEAGIRYFKQSVTSIKKSCTKPDLQERCRVELINTDTKLRRRGKIQRKTKSVTD